MSIKKIALVTGANQGIGFATVKELLEKGITVILSARDEKKGLEALQSLKSYENCYFHQMDVSDINSIKETKNFIENKFGRLDILVNNAAINYDTWQDVLNANLDEVAETFDTNLMGVWRVTQVFAPLMKKNKYGRIVNISSGGGSFASQTGETPAYSLSKHALNALTRQFANKLKNDGILVNALCPGWVRTSMGGMTAPRSAKSAAKGIVWACLLKDSLKTGKFFREKEIIDW